MLMGHQSTKAEQDDFAKKSKPTRAVYRANW